jgi:hypothetical protein
MKNNINQRDGVVNKKINPLFKNLYGALGFDDDFHYEPSLESQVSTWTKPRDDSGDDIRFTVNMCPEIIKSTIWRLKNKHENLPNQSAVQRFLTKAGITILEKIPSLKKLNDQRKEAYETGSEQDRLALMVDRHYSVKYRISMSHFKMTIYTFNWVGSKITEIASDLFLPQEIIVIESLIAGISTSERWVPRRYRDQLFDEMIRFVSWVEEMSNKV